MDDVTRWMCNEKLADFLILFARHRADASSKSKFFQEILKDSGFKVLDDYALITILEASGETLDLARHEYLYCNQVKAWLNGELGPAWYEDPEKKILKLPD